MKITSALARVGTAPAGGSHSFPEWFAVYTTSRHEKRVVEHLAIREIESFLPLYRSLRSWKNGCKVNVELPLFPSYVFVRLNRGVRVRVLEIPGVLSFVSVGNQPAPLPEFEIEALRSGIQSLKWEPHPYLVVGEKTRIKTGPLAGFEGVLLRKKGLLRVVISLELIMKSVAVEVNATDVEPIGPRVSHDSAA